MDSSVKDIDGEILLVLQFILYGNCHKGRRQSFHESVSGDIACVLFAQFFEELLLMFPAKRKREFLEQIWVYV